MGHQAIAMTPPRGGGGDQYKVPIPDKYSPRGQKSPSEFLFQCEQFFDASGFPLERQVPLQPHFYQTLQPLGGDSTERLGQH